MGVVIVATVASGGWRFGGRGVIVGLEVAAGTVVIGGPGRGDALGW